MRSHRKIYCRKLLTPPSRRSRILPSACPETGLLGVPRDGPTMRPGLLGVLRDSLRCPNTEFVRRQEIAASTVALRDTRLLPLSPPSHFPTSSHRVDCQPLSVVILFIQQYGTALRATHKRSSAEGGSEAGGFPGMLISRGLGLTSTVPVVPFLAGGLASHPAGGFGCAEQNAVCRCTAIRSQHRDLQENS